MNLNGRDKLIPAQETIAALEDTAQQTGRSRNKLIQTAAIADSYHLVVPSTVLPEVDYLATKYLGEAVAQAFLQEVTFAI